MLSSDLFDKLDIIGRRIRNNINPFGGIQLILCGDFFQLPPIGVGRMTDFCFESAAWKQLFGTTLAPTDSSSSSSSATMTTTTTSVRGEIILLEKVFRQKDDVTFLNLLNSLRKGQVTPEIQQILLRKVHESMSIAEHEKLLEQQELAGLVEKDHHREEKVRATKLFSTNEDVDKYNANELERLLSEDEPRIFISVDEGKEPYMGQLQKGTKAPQTLLLKLGAQVRKCLSISFFFSNYSLSVSFLLLFRLCY
jgi:ATP-dependent DNA helicase PIF1